MPVLAIDALRRPAFIVVNDARDKFVAHHDGLIG